MKIEKGKLYYNTISNSVFKCQIDVKTGSLEEHLMSSCTDEIAVHCPTKEDWDYVIRSYIHLTIYDHWSSYKSKSCIYVNSNMFGNLSSISPNSHIITIQEYKEFYPDVENWEEKAKQEALKSVEELASKAEGSVTLEISGSKSGLIGNINPSHYTTLSIQPIDYIEANKLDFNEGNVIKYVSRYKQKNGLEDLKKARFYIDRLIETNSK